MAWLRTSRLQLRTAVLIASFLSLGACKFQSTQLKASKRENGSSGSMRGSVSIPTHGESGPSPSPTSPVGDLPPAQPDPQGPSNAGKPTPSNPAGNLSISANGLLKGDNVHNDLNLKSGSYKGGKPKGIILHKTAGKSCRSNNTVSNKAPHIFICRDGRIIVNGSFDNPRTAAEKFHNDWSLNIEFDAAYEHKTSKAACDKRKEMTWGQTSPKHSPPEKWRGHCYQELTEEQVKVGREVMELLSKRFDIPLKPSIDVKTQREYVSQHTNILQVGSYGPRSFNPSNMSPGVLPSFWTARSALDVQGRDPKNLTSNGKQDGNHDDGPSWYDLKRLGIIPQNAPN